MLPAFDTNKFRHANLRRAAIAALTAFAVALPSAPAFAWGQREQDVLKGIVGTLLIQGIIKESQKASPQVRKAPAPRYAKPAPKQYYYKDSVPRHKPRHQPRATSSIYSTPAAAAFNSYSMSERRMIQRRLSAMGYYRGGIDGAFGPGTFSAITAYARDQGLARDLVNTRSTFGIYDTLIF